VLVKVNAELFVHVLVVVEPVIFPDVGAVDNVTADAFEEAVLLPAALYATTFRV